MDKIVYLYGSARDAATRAIRRNVFPREIQVRLGPWIVRPARRVAVDFVRLAPFAAELISKIQSGVVQVQRPDSSVISIEELTSAFKALGGSSGAPDYTQMPLGELHALMRVDRPEPAAWEAFVRRSLKEKGDAALEGLRQRSMTLKASGFDTSVTDALLGASPAVAAPEPPPPASAPPAPVEAPEPAPEPEPEPEPEPMAEPASSREDQLPDGWQLLSKGELIDLCNDHGIPLPSKASKTNLVAAVEAWLGGD